MGRSSGGGSHSSGGFSGGHSSGGFSGGGRSSGSSRPSGGDFSHIGGGGRPHNNFFFGGPGPRGPRDYRDYRDYSGISILTFAIAFLIIISIISTFSSSSNKSSDIPKNTKERTALSGVVNKTDWYDDQIGWVSSKSVLINGLEEFYNKTGIQPYILFVPYSSKYWNNENLNSTVADEYLEEVYNETFSDEGHFILAYFKCQNDSIYEMNGEFRYLSGHSADTIMDSEAISILWGYLDKNYYDTSLSLEEMISNTFSETASAIMSRPTNGWDVLKVIIIIAGIVAIIVIIYFILKDKNKREKEKEEYTKEILNKPLDTFGDDVSEIEKKYK